jgi:MFS family permease
MRTNSQAAGLYLAALEFVFALGWTVYAIYLPKLAASVGITGGAVIFILMLDQAVFTITDFSMGIAADKVSPLVGRLGHWVAAITLVSCLAFVALPFIAKSGLGAAPFLALTVTWAITSSALRAPPLMLLGKYAARPAIPYLASLAMLGLGVANAISPYLAITLTRQDPRLPFIIASIAVVLTSLALAKAERTLARNAAKTAQPPKSIDRAVPAPVTIFTLAVIVFALGFQLHASFNSPALFKKFTPDIGNLMPVFWVGFSVGMFPASRITRRWGGLPVMGLAGLVGAAAIVLADISGSLGGVVAAQLIAGASWGCILMSAFTAAAALGYTGTEGKMTGLLYSALAVATFARMATVATGALADPSFAPLLHWAPIACWAIAGLLLVAVCVASIRRVGNVSTNPATS